jgi:hypothetical protein
MLCEDLKYKKGLFYSRMELWRLSKELELTSNAMKFNIVTAVHFILKRYGLWKYAKK